MKRYEASITLVTIVLIIQNNTVLSLKNLKYGEVYPKLSRSCPKKDVMVIKGYDVKLSDFVRSNGDIYNLCSFKSHLKVIKVFALKTLVLDRDVDVAGSHLKLFIVAPKWVVVGDRRIAVDGTIGKYMPRANSGSSSNTTGADGKPGDPGGPGGNFVGVGDTFVNGHRLVITANGGIGGTGQYGGHGYDAPIARYADGESVRKITCETCYYICKGVDKNVRINLEDNLGMYNNFTCLGLFEKKGNRSCSCTIYGWKGEDGGKGGNGGRGGIGGLPGSVMLVAVNNDSHKISTYGIPGRRGMNGEGGVGGKSGEDGHNVVYTNTYTSTPKVEHEKGQMTLYRLGSNGSDGYNSVGYRENRVAPDVLEHVEIEKVLFEHKTWLRGISGLVMNDEDIVLFYRKMYDNRALTNLYNATHLLKEIKDIDAKYFELRRYVIFTLYESALGRVYGFAEPFVKNTSHGQGRIFHGLFYNDILGRIYNFPQQPDTFISVNMLEGFDLEEMNINEIRDIVKQNNFDSTNQFDYKHENKNPINDLTNKSKMYLEKKIKFFTIRRSYYVDKYIHDYVNNLCKAKKQPKKYKQKIIRLDKALNNFLVTKSYLTSFKLLIDFFSILYEFAEIVSSVVEVGAIVPKTLVVEKKSVPKPVVLRELLQKLNRSISAFKTKEVTLVKVLLDNVLYKARSNPETLTDVTEQLLMIELKLQGRNRLYAINALRSDLLKVLKMKLKELSAYIKANKKVKKRSKVVKSRRVHSLLYKVIKLATLSRGFSDIYNEYNHIQSNLDIIIQCTKTPKPLLLATIQTENSIYGLIYPLVQSIQDMIRDSSGNPELLSELIFAFIEQDLRFGLIKINQSIRRLAKSSTVNKDVVGITNDLGEVGTALRAIFDRLQNYLHLSKLEHLIVDASTPVGMGVIFPDVLMSNGFEFIDTYLSSVLMLKNYKNTIDNFKNFVFPIAQVFLKDIILPEHFDMFDSFHNLYSTTMTQMDTMLEKLEEYKSLVLAGDKIVSRKDFGNRLDPPSEPFFVWKNEQNKDAIFKLMSGEKVVLTADISKSSLTDNAIKLNSIEIYFKSKDKAKQEKIDSIMAYFWIEVTHSGRSQYRYGDQIFLTTSESCSIVYSFQNNKRGEPMSTGGSYWLMRNASVMLSPYASWELHIDKPEKIFITYKDLLEFKDDVDLELGGNGYYISKENMDKNKDILNVEILYKPIGKFKKNQKVALTM